MNPLINFISLLIITCLCSDLKGQVPPATFSHSMTFNGKQITVQFEKFSTRGPNFQVIAQVAGGGLQDQTASFSEVRTYIGSVEEHSGAVACAVVRDGGRGIQANVIFESGYQWFDQNGTVIDFSPVDTLVIPNFPTFQLRSGGADTTLYSADIGMDLAHDVYTASGGSVAAAVEMAEFSLMVNNLPFLRDASIINRLRRLVIRSDQNSDPFANGSVNMVGNTPWSDGITEDLLSLASNQVNTPTAALEIGQPGLSFQPAESNGEHGGTMRHEVGHNWGMGHQDGGQPEGKTISSGNELAKFSGPAIENILKRRDLNLAILNNLGTFSSHDIPPRAADDIYIYEPGSAGSIVMNVMDNDRDVNGTAISILSFDSHTQGGIPITQQGNNLTIPRPSIFNLATDRFSYRIQDASGQTSTAFVNLKAVIPGDELACWTFKNTTNRGHDSSSKLNTLRLYGNATVTNEELVLDGQTDFAKGNSLGVNTNQITFSAMVNSDGTQTSQAGIIVGSDRYGMKFGENNELEFIWNEMPFITNLSVANNTWTLVAMVITPTSATFYTLPQGGTLQSETRNGNFASIELTDIIMIGDGGGADFDAIPPYMPYFKGKMDDIRIINRSLTQDEIIQLAQKRIGAKDPIPYHTEALDTSNVTLKWTPSPNAMAQKLYISTDYEAVKNGEISAELSSIGPSTDSINLTNLSGSIFWRIETTEMNDSIYSGNIWNFFLGAKNHNGSCNGLLNTCYSAEFPTGIAFDGNDVYSVGTTGPFEANWAFVQKNTGQCGAPEQCLAQNSFGGNNISHAIAFVNNIVVVTTSAGIAAYNHSGTTPCSEVWSEAGGYKGVVAKGNRLFVSEVNEIVELDITDGSFISSVEINTVSSIERLTNGPGDTLYFTSFQSGTSGGVGFLNVTTDVFSLLPNEAGNGLKNPGGLTVSPNGNVVVAETDKRRVVSIYPSSGAISTYVDGLISPRDVLFAEANLYIADGGSHNILSITCNAGDCPSSLILSGINNGNESTNNTMRNNQSSGNITSNQTINSPIHTIIYNSAMEVLLQADFEVVIPSPLPTSGYLFEVSNDGCNSN